MDNGAAAPVLLAWWCEDTPLKSVEPYILFETLQEPSASVRSGLFFCLVRLPNCLSGVLPSECC
jgi:hypothetical protein